MGNNRTTISGGDANEITQVNVNNALIDRRYKTDINDPIPTIVQRPLNKLMPACIPCFRFNSSLMSRNLVCGKLIVNSSVRVY